ncbi:MAG: sulfatase-like hydrolase/transferase [Muribaculaceae bacterium]|nr:sulfatase-like hydrolase/transferase [Muribaculaceae bacterium]
MKSFLKAIHCEDSLWAPLIATAVNIVVLFVIAFIARTEFYLANIEFFSATHGFGDFLRIAVAGARFDLPGILYVNLLYILMMLFPLHLKECPGYYKVCKWVFVILNSLALLTNLGDSIYYPYTLRRSTWDVTTEFANESNQAAVVGVEMLPHWWVVVLAVVLIWGMWKLYVSPSGVAGRKGGWRYYVVMLISLVFAAAICVGGIRGGWLNHWQNYIFAFPILYIAWRIRRYRRNLSLVLTGAGVALLLMAPVGGFSHRDIRPLALSNANAYAAHPSETALILNTPFSIIRTLKGNPFPVVKYFTDHETMAREFSPVHTHKAQPTDSAMLRKNVVVIILESFGEEYIDALNDRALGKDSPGYAPFMDSLARRSLRFTHTYDNGNKSIDAMPSILASIPKFSKSFILTSSAVDAIDGLPALLGKEGYSTAFFHGARTGSMGFDGFARLVGFNRYFGREDFEKDKRFGGSDEFDGYWAIWDEPFFQYFAAQLTELPQPFMASIFSATSHHPFNVPPQYEGKFPKGNLPIHQCIGYTDLALRRFFEAAEKTDWYRNTIFVITNDHTNQRGYDEYRSDIGVFYGPILIFDPTGETVAPGLRDGIISQIDIMPTLLGLLRYPSDYTAYGRDMSQVAAKGQAVSYINNLYQFVEGDYILRFDGTKSVALYAIDDHLMARNLLSSHPEEAKKMETRLKALIQTYMERHGR